MGFDAKFVMLLEARTVWISHTKNYRYWLQVSWSYRKLNSGQFLRHDIYRRISSDFDEIMLVMLNEDKKSRLRPRSKPTTS